MPRRSCGARSVQPRAAPSCQHYSTSGPTGRVSSGRCPGGFGREQVEGLGQNLIDGDVGDERGLVVGPAVFLEAVGTAGRTVQPPGGRGPVPGSVQRPVGAEADTPVDGNGGRADGGGQMAWS